MNCFVKESYGVIWHFYHNSHGICYCKMTDENIREYQVLIPDGKEDFDVITDDSNSIYIVYQNNDGDILYANHFNGKWKKAALLKSKSKSNYQKNFVLKRVGNLINLFYCIEYNGKRMLTHQMISDEATTPNVVDCIVGDFMAETDSGGNIYLLFNSERAKGYGLKRYVWNQKEWGEFKPIDKLLGCKNPYLFIDTADELHILYERDYFIFEYFRQEEKSIGTGQKPLMIYRGENIAMWEGVMENKIYIKKGDDESPTVFMPGSFSSPVKFKLCYTSYESDIKALYCKGNIINGVVKLYGINGFFIVSSTAPKPLGQQNYPGFEGNMEIEKLKIKLSQMYAILEDIKSRLDEYDNKKIHRRLENLETAMYKD